jgi:hypothetical protein
MPTVITVPWVCGINFPSSMPSTLISGLIARNFFGQLKLFPNIRKKQGLKKKYLQKLPLGQFSNKKNRNNGKIETS